MPVAAKRLRGGAAFTSLDVSLSRLRTLHSPYIGVVNDTFELLSGGDDIRSYYVGSEAADSVETLGHPCNTQNGGGAFVLDSAVAAALGEAVERYCGAFRPEDRICFGAADEIRDTPGPTPVDPSRCALFAVEQYAQEGFPFVPFTAQTPISWINGIDLRTGDGILVPAQIVLLNSRRHPDEPRIAYGTSSGLACHGSTAEATLLGVLELLERDAVMIAWHARLSLPRIDLHADPEVAAIVRRHMEPTGLQHLALDLSSITGVPTAMGLVINDRNNVGALGVGAASAPTLAEAAVSALLEAFHVRVWSKFMQRSTSPIDDDADLDLEIADFDAHVRYYADRDRLPFAEFLHASDERTDPRDAPRLDGQTPGEILTEILELETLADVRFIATDLTTVDVAEAGLSVVRAYSPELQPLDVGYRTRCLGGRRLRERPAELGYRNSPLEITDMNPHPHPFP